MKKRSFLKNTSILLAGSHLVPNLPLDQSDIGTNWAGNLHYSAKRLHKPRTRHELQPLIKARKKLRALGTRHSFNSIADCDEELISTRGLDKILDLNRKENVVVVEGGVRYGELSAYLHSQGFALHNLASLPHISVAGACSTATHGSGITNGNLASKVQAIEIIRADGSMAKLSRVKDGDRFAGSVVGLGSLGLINKITLSIEPTFDVRQDIYEHIPLGEIKGNFEAIMLAGYSVSFFTDYSEKKVNQIWIKRKVEDAGEGDADAKFYGGRLASRKMHPIADISAEHCTEQMGVSGPWHERLPHFKLDFTPSSGAELQSEYFVPQEHAFESLIALQKMNKIISPHLLISEVRTIAADDLWMSTTYGRPSVAFHFTWKPDWPSVQKVLPKIEAALTPYDVRPHWGKLFTMPSEVLKTRYPRWEDFKALTLEFDPDGVFQNAFMHEVLGT